MIAQQNTAAARLWLDLCELLLKSRLSGLKILDTPELKLLETMRVISTTETNDMIIVKIFSLISDGEEVLFCGDKSHA
jgi:hypothetical protein